MFMQLWHDITTSDHAIATYAMLVLSVFYFIYQLWSSAAVAFGLVVFIGIMIAHNGLQDTKGLAARMPYILLVSLFAATIVGIPIRSPNKDGFVEGFTDNGDDDNGDEEGGNNEGDNNEEEGNNNEEEEGNDEEEGDNDEEEEGNDEEEGDNDEEERGNGEEEGDNNEEEEDNGEEEDNNDEEEEDNEDVNEEFTNNRRKGRRNRKRAATRSSSSRAGSNKETFVGSIDDDDAEPFKVNEFKSFLDTYKNVTPSQLKSMTEDTKSLLDTQKTLINTIKTMSPVLKEGKEVLDTFKDYFSVDDKKAMAEMLKGYK